MKNDDDEKKDSAATIANSTVSQTGDSNRMSSTTSSVKLTQETT